MEYAWLIVPLSIFAMAFVFNGFPSLITINKYSKSDKEEQI
jgi:hypothetical protein